MAKKTLGFDKTLSDYGFTEKDIPEITTMVMKHLKYMTEQTPFEVSEDIIKDILLKSL